VLAVDNDKLVLRLAVKATQPTTVTGAIDWSASNIPTEFRPGDGDQNFLDVNAATDGSVLLDQLRQVAEKFDTDEVPEEMRFVALPPAQYNLLVQNQDLLNRDFGGMNGIFSDGTVFKAWGMELMKSNHIPTTDTSGDGTVGIRGVNYNIDATGTVAVCWQKDGLLGVRAPSMSMEKGRLIQYRGTLMVASVVTGYDTGRPLNLARVGTS